MRTLSREKAAGDCECRRAITFCGQIISKIHSYNKSGHQDDPSHQPILGFPVLFVTMVILILDMVFLFMTSGRDPGMVPRNLRPPEADEAFDMTTPSMEWISGRTPHLRLPRTREVLVDGFSVKTTYENFRYRYDKKENPYNKGALENFKELFFSKIPPSMNDFRSWVMEDTAEIGPCSPNIGMDITNPMGGNDREMGSKPDGNSPIPRMLQNLDYNAISENLDCKDRHQDDAVDPLALHMIQETTDQEPRESDHICREADGAAVIQWVDKEVVEMVVDDRDDKESCSNGTSAPIDHVVHMPPI
ncbi:S-acyltransferase [Cocos nucifera]|uniref:S-acyltransferase n=1 Tax=Cocos nucifera TaxID=13894 RepID=A0A8K0I5W4_COCNU|nr:S-acyltransferase [Cocos nucifera]